MNYFTNESGEYYVEVAHGKPVTISEGLAKVIDNDETFHCEDENILSILSERPDLHTLFYGGGLNERMFGEKACYSAEHNGWEIEYEDDDGCQSEYYPYPQTPRTHTKGPWVIRFNYNHKEGHTKVFYESFKSDPEEVFPFGVYFIGDPDACCHLIDSGLWDIFRGPKPVDLSSIVGPGSDACDTRYLCRRVSRRTLLTNSCDQVWHVIPKGPTFDVSEATACLIDARPLILKWGARLIRAIDERPELASLLGDDGFPTPDAIFNARKTWAKIGNHLYTKYIDGQHWRVELLTGHVYIDDVLAHPQENPVISNVLVSIEHGLWVLNKDSLDRAKQERAIRDALSTLRQVSVLDPKSSSFLAVDVHYVEDRAYVAGILFQKWDSTKPDAMISIVVHSVAPYEPGAFYKRELPCIYALYERVKALGYTVKTLIIDGYVDLDSGKPGLGRYIFRSIPGYFEVVGVAKTYFQCPTARSILRGGSKKPLYVTTSSGNIEKIAESVRLMAGSHRIPLLLKTVDSVTRLASSEDSV